MQPKLPEIPVRFGTLSIPAGEACLPIAILRTDCTLDVADRFLCGRRLKASIEARPDRVDQPALPITPDPRLTGEFRVFGFSVGRSKFTATLKLARGGLSLDALAEFTGRVGVMQIHACEDLPVKQSHASAAASARRSTNGKHRRKEAVA